MMESLLLVGDPRPSWPLSPPQTTPDSAVGRSRRSRPRPRQSLPPSRPLRASPCRSRGASPATRSAWSRDAFYEIPFTAGTAAATAATTTRRHPAASRTGSRRGQQCDTTRVGLPRARRPVHAADRPRGHRAIVDVVKELLERRHRPSRTNTESGACSPATLLSASPTVTNETTSAPPCRTSVTQTGTPRRRGRRRHRQRPPRP